MKKILSILLFLLLNTICFAACLGHSPGEVYFNAYSKDGNGNYTIPALYKTTNYGQTATLIKENFDAEIFKDKAEKVFYRRDFYNGQGFYYSPDSMKTWILRYPQYNSIKTGTSPGVVFGGVSYYSTDYGNNWLTTAHNGLPYQGIYSWCLGQESGEVYVYMYDEKLYHSTDYGDNFTLVNDTVNLGSAVVNRGWQSGELLIGAAGSMFRSTDYGASFNYISYIDIPGDLIWGKMQGEMVSISIRRYPQMIYNQMYIKFHRSNDYGQSWDSTSTNFNVGIEDNVQCTIDNVKLANYPNPFNNSTVVNYQLKKDDEINLAVFNSKGELVRKFFEGQQKAGNHQVFFDAAGLNSGMYYIRLQGKNTAQTVKCLYLK